MSVQCSALQCSTSSPRRSRGPVRLRQKPRDEHHHIRGVDEVHALRDMDGYGWVLMGTVEYEVHFSKRWVPKKISLGKAENGATTMNTPMENQPANTGFKANMEHIWCAKTANSSYVLGSGDMEIAHGLTEKHAKFLVSAAKSFAQECHSQQAT